MSLRVSRNLGPFTMAAETLFALKEWFCYGHPGTKHWSVTLSSDGTTWGAGDNLPTAASLNNNGAWMVLRDADGNREIELANYGSSYSHLWYCMYSKGCLFTLLSTGPGGLLPPAGATERAKATDEKAFHVNRVAPPSAYLSFPSSGQWYTHIVAEGDTPDGNVYPFWCVSRMYGTGLVAATIAMDCVIDSLSPAGDTDKALLLGTQNNLNSMSSAYLSYGEPTFTNLSGYMAYGHGAGVEEWGGLGGLSYGGSGVGSLVPGSLDANPEDSKYGALPFFVFRTATTTPGLKGQANLLRWKSASGMNYGDTIYDGTDYYLVVDDVALRGWPDSTAPII